MEQQGITSADLKPYLARVRARIEKNPNSPAWGQLDGRWLAVVEHARSVIAYFESGRAGQRHERRAAYEVIKIADATTPRDVVETVLAMFMMQELEPRRFRADTAFRFQLVRRVRALADLSAGQYYDHRTNKVRRVYRELSPRAATVVGQWLAEALGVAGVHLARLEQRDEERQRNERLELHKALEELE